MSPRIAAAMLLVCLACASVICGCADNEGTIGPAGPVPLSAIVPVTVRVMSAATDAPIPGATVSFKTSHLYFAGLDPLKSDREGRVDAGVLNGYRVDLDVFADRHKPASRSFTLENQSGPVEYFVFLAPDRLPD